MRKINLSYYNFDIGMGVQFWIGGYFDKKYKTLITITSELNIKCNQNLNVQYLNKVNKYLNKMYYAKKRFLFIHVCKNYF